MDFVMLANLVPSIISIKLVSYFDRLESKVSEIVQSSANQVEVAGLWTQASLYYYSIKRCRTD
ncbi:hypothetical protein JT359_13845 [Candidatus Poribacteria bacterium]|nr:hypothetical protein [Candidatus Poribacteria bacterium]